MQYCKTQPELTGLEEIHRAHKRCMQMGKHLNFCTSYNQHELAPCMKNYTDMLDNSLREKSPDYDFCMYCIWTMAKRINKFCDSKKVSTSEAAQYWLECFLHLADSVYGISTYMHYSDACSKIYGKVRKVHKGYPVGPLSYS